MAGKINIVGENVTLSSSGGAGGSLEDLLQQDELGVLSVDLPNTISDDFNTDIADNSNTHIAGSELFITSGVSGYVQYELETTQLLSSVNAKLKMKVPAYAPIAEPINDVTGVIKISGDLTSSGFNIFATGKDIVVCKQFESLGKTRYKFQYNETDGIVKRFTPTLVSYVSGTGNTEITLGDQSANYDLDFATVSGNIPDTIRVMPFDFMFEASGDGLTNLESINLKSLDAIDAVAIPGESTLREIGNISGAIFRTAAKMSPNGQFGAIVVLENDGTANSTGVLRWFKTIDRGQNWTAMVTTKTVGGSGGTWDGDELSFGHLSLHRDQLVISNNGKFFGCWTDFAGGNYIKAVYADLASTTTLTDVPNLFSAGVGIIRTHANELYASADGDLDNGYVAVFSASTVTNDGRIHSIKNLFTSPAADINAGAVPGDTTASNECRKVIVSGSGTSHVISKIAKDAISLDLTYAQWNEGNGTAAASGNFSSSIDHTFMDALLIGNNVVVLMRDAVSDVMKFRTLSVSSLGVLGTHHTLSNLGPDYFHGHSSATQQNWHKTLSGHVKKGPISDNHVLFCVDLVHPDSVRRPHVFEVQDISAYQGYNISQTVYGPGNDFNFRSSATIEKHGQIFDTTADWVSASRRIRTITTRLYQVGTVASGTINCKIYATSGGLPTGAALFTSSNSIDATKLTKSTSGQICTFNFSNVTGLTASTRYAFVLEGTFAIDASNYVRINGNSGNPYNPAAGADRTYFNGSVWALGTGDDFVFTINGDFETELGNAKHSTLSVGADSEHNFESQIENIDTNQLQFITRRVMQAQSSANNYPHTGHPYRRVINLSSVLGTQSTYTALTQAAYNSASFDENLVFSVGLGTDDCRKQNMTTGAFDAASSSDFTEDRSGWNHTIANQDSNGSVVDSSFWSGKALVFDGSADRIQYNDSAAFDLYFNRAFCIELEVNAAVNNGNDCLLMTTNSSAQGGFDFYLGNTNAGEIWFRVFNSAGGSLAQSRSNGGFIPTSTYKVIRILYEGTGGNIKLYTANSPTGTFTEVTYNTQSAFTSGNTSGITQELSIGRNVSGADHFNGKIGYVKFVQNTTTFQYIGFKNQAPCTQITNLGSSIICEMQKGQNRNPQDSSGNYDELSISRIDRSKVDSLELYATLSKTLANTGSKAAAKISMKRQSVNNTSSLPGIIYKFEG